MPLFTASRSSDSCSSCNGDRPSLKDIERLQRIREDEKEQSVDTDATCQKDKCKYYPKYKKVRRLHEEICDELEDKDNDIREVYNKISRQKEKCLFCRKNYDINIDESKQLTLTT
jgi:hypothetical protein